MDAELKAKWVKALRSEKYKQARGALTDGGGFCCLGVFADVAGCEWICGANPHKDGLSVRSAGGEWLRPSFAGLSEETQLCLARLNDGGKSFSEIADYIEANL